MAEESSANDHSKSPDVVVVPHEVTTVDPLEETTDALTRNFSHLNVPLWVCFIALAAAFRTVLLHPLNLATSRKRVYAGKISESTYSILANLVRQGQGAASSGTVPLSKRILSIRHIYRGLGVAIVGNAIGDVIVLLMLESIRTKLMKWIPAGHSSWQDGIGGVFGDVMAINCTLPLSVVCNRQMTAGYGLAKESVYRPAARTASEVWQGSGRTDGVKGIRAIYVGLSMTYAMLPASAIWWSTYSEVKYGLYSLARSLEKKDNTEEWQNPTSLFLTSTTDNLILNGLASCVAGAFTTAIFNPINLIRTRLQTTPHLVGRHKGGRILLLCEELVKKEGVRAFWKGTLVNMTNAMSEGVIFSQMYELTKWAADITKTK